MPDPEIVVETRGPAAWITLNRPQARNALTFAMYDRLPELCAQASQNPALKCIVIAGAGERAFAAGTDINQFRAFAAEADVLDYERRVEAALAAIETCPLPVIAAIAGACTGGGAIIAAAADIRLATPALRYGFPIARTLGNSLSIANLARLAALLGPARLKEIILTARLIQAEEALACGLVSELLPSYPALVARAEALAAQIAAHAPITLRAAKEGLRRLRVDGPAAHGQDLVLAAAMSADFREGMDAFLNKRPPRWQGR